MKILQHIDFLTIEESELGAISFVNNDQTKFSKGFKLVSKFEMFEARPLTIEVGGLSYTSTKLFSKNLSISTPISELEDISFRLVNSGNAKVFSAPVLKAMLYHKALQSTGWKRTDKSLVAFYERNYPERRKSSLFYCDIDKELVFSTEASVAVPNVISNTVVGWDMDLSCLRLFDHELNELWRWNPLGGIAHYSFKGVLPIGELNEDVVFSPGTHQTDSSACTLFSLALKDGKLNWQVDIPGTLYDFSAHQGGLFVLTDSDVHLINPETGKIEHTSNVNQGEVIHEKFYKQSVRRQTVNKLYITDQYTYVFVRHECRMYVFETFDLTLVKAVDFPSEWYADHVSYEDKESGSLFLTVSRTDGYEYHRNGILEVNPSKLEETVEVEKGPDTTVELEALSTGSKTSALNITIRTDSFDDAIRFGELHSQNYAYIYGFSVTHHCEPNPQFNGHVNLKILSTEIVAEKLQPMLGIMEKRFEHWAQKNYIYSGDGENNYCSLTTKYIKE